MTSSTDTTRILLSREIGSIDEPLNRPYDYIKVIQKKTVMHLKEDSVAVSWSELRTGETTTGKRWYRWSKVKSYSATFRGRGNGPRRIFLYHFNSWKGSMNKRESSFSDRSGFSIEWAEFFKAHESVFVEFSARMEKYFPYVKKKINPGFLDNLGMYGVLCAYPALNDFPGWYDEKSQYFRVASTIQRGLREETATKCLKVAFGKTRSNKKLVKALASTLYKETAIFAMYFRGKVPTDWISEGVLKSTEDSVYLTGRREDPGSDRIRKNIISEILENIPESRKREFFLSLFTSEYTNDTFRLLEWNYLNDSIPTLLMDARTIDDLHAACVTAQANRHNTRTKVERVYRDIKMLEPALKYHNMHIGENLLVVAPKSESDLYDWSTFMGNCISGYCAPAVAGQLFLGAVYSGDVLLANFEIDQEQNLKQLLGRFNAELTEDKRNAIIDALADVKAIHLDSVTNAWGVPTYTPINERKLIEA